MARWRSWARILAFIAAFVPAQTLRRGEPPPVAARPDATIEDGVRLEAAGAPSVFQFKPKLLRAYYDTDDGGIALAQSRDGLRFRKPRDARIEIADAAASGPSVVKIDGKLRMYVQVEPDGDPGNRSVWRATARDRAGKRWTVDGPVFEMTAKPCKGWTSDPAAAVLPGVGVRLYFGCGTSGVASALSSDGEEFTFEGRLIDDAADPYVIALDDGTLRMFYTAGAGSVRASKTGTEIRTAISIDGLDWTGTETIATATDLGAAAAYGPAAYRLDDGTWRLYVSTTGTKRDAERVLSAIWEPEVSTGFEVRMPVDWSDIAVNVYGIWPFGVHGADHIEDGHPGWDVEFDNGASVRAAAAGTVQSVFADSNGSGRSTVQISHAADGGSYRTIYTNVGTVDRKIVAGASVQSGQAIGIAGTLTLTIGSSPVTFSMTHFQVDDFSQNSGISNVNAVSPETVLSAGGRAVFSALWQSAAYSQELTEPFATNARDNAVPVTRLWTRRSGRLAKRIAFRYTGSSYEYTLQAGSGATIEAGTATVSAGGAKLATIDLRPSSGGASRLGVYDIVEETLRIDYGTPGDERPTDLSNASVYTTPPPTQRTRR